MVTLKEYEAYLKVKRFIDGHDESEIISRIINESNVPLMIESDGADLIKYYATSAAAKCCGVTKQTLDYAHRNRCTRIVGRKGGVKEFRIKWLQINIFIHIKIPHSKFSEKPAFNENHGF